MPPRPWSLTIAMFCFGCALAMLGCGRTPVKEHSAEEEFGEPPDPPVKKSVDSSTVRPEANQDGPVRSVGFMGARGTGRRFCMIADHSNSLSPVSLAQIKQEIATTLRSLGEETPFYLIFFAKTPLAMPADNWRQGKAEVDKVERWMTGVLRSEGTLATPAFKKAMALQPRPDVIFLMTDGRLHGKDPAGSIAALNTALPKTVIHTILFTRKAAALPDGAAARVILETIARDSGGEYRQYVADADELPAKKKKGKK